MKKVLVLLILFSTFLTACSFGQNQNIGRHTDLPEQEIIIQDFIGEPLPPKSNGVKYMEECSIPQKIPNVNLLDPIVITKMPYKERP